MSARVVVGGPWNGRTVRRARKAARCWDRSCKALIKPGDDYVETEVDPDYAGGFGMHKSCMACACVESVT